MSFTGNPGTGKTTVAMKMAQSCTGSATSRSRASSRAHATIWSASTSATPRRRRRKCCAAPTAACSSSTRRTTSTGPRTSATTAQEAIEILLQVMEAERDKLVVIFAGYKDRMDDFFRSNPGLSSRVAHHIDFPDYDVDELMAIAHLMMDAAELRVRRGRRGRVPRVPRAARQAAALRPRPQRPQLDRPRAAAAGEPPLRRRQRHALARRADDDHARRHPARAASSRRTASPKTTNRRQPLGAL